jgi:chromosome condensin MukBEF ATPase and DNA-binding subunit MukB
VNGMTDKEILEQFQMIMTAIEGSTASLKNEFREEIRQSEVRTKIFIENTVLKRLDSLHDGFQMNRERIDALERNQQDMDEDIDNTKTRVSILENEMA